MELAHVNYAHYSIYEITRSFVAKILSRQKSIVDGRRKSGIQDTSKKR